MDKKVPLHDPEGVKHLLKKEIIAYMKSEGMTQDEVAEMCGLRSTYINQVLGTKSVSFAKLCEIADKIGLRLTLVIEKKIGV